MRSIASVILFASVVYAQPSFMLGAKTFTLDFEGYSGFMLELGLSREIIFQKHNDKLVLGLQSGFGYSSKDYSEENLKIEASSIGVPIKLFLAQRLLGVSIGTLLSFYDTKVKGGSINLGNLDDKGKTAYFDFGLMIFPMEKISISFDAITKNSITGFAIGVAYHFSKKRNLQNQNNNDYHKKSDCSNEASFIQESFIDKEDENLYACIRLRDKKLSCLKLSDRSEFENESLEAIENFDTKSSYLKWNKIQARIPYSEFFPNGFCD